jgi:hypothetical protein
MEKLSFGGFGKMTETIGKAAKPLVSHSGTTGGIKSKAFSSTSKIKAPKKAGNPNFGKSKSDSAYQMANSTRPPDVLLTNTASIDGERPMKYSIQHAYNQGVQDAIEKVANPMMMQPQMDPMMQQQQMMMDPMAMGQMPPEPQPPMAPPMQDVQMQQQGMVEAPGQPTPDELQQVQDSGITSNDIASAAKVIQTMAEMKANADIMGMQPTPEEAQIGGAPAQGGVQPVQPSPNQAVSMGVRG